MVTLLRYDTDILLFVLSALMPMWGYTRLMLRFGRVEAPFVPLFVFAAQTLAVCIAGICGITGAVRFVASAISWGGCICLAVSFCPALRPRKDKTSDVCIVFAVTAAWIIYASFDQKVLHCDNFTHWAQIVKVMLKNDALPTAADTVITFTSYPPGTACFIYSSICGWRGAPEWTYIASQGMLIAACVMTVCAVLPKNKFMYLVGAFVFGIACTVFTEQIYELLVDGVLGALTSACFFYIIYRRTHGKAPDGLVLGCMLALLALVKNSGMLFAAFLAALAYLPLKKGGGELKDIVICILIPAVMYIVWRVHVKMTFTDVESAKHSVSASYYAKVFGSKSAGDIMQTVRVFASRTWRKRRIRIVLLVLLAVRLFMRKDSRTLPKCISRIPVIAAVFYCVYLAGMLCVYIFSMRQSEALSLGGYFRYFKTMEIVLVGMEMCYITALGERISKTREQTGRYAPVICCVMMLAWFVCSIKDCEPRFLLRQVISDDDPRVKAERALEGYRSYYGDKGIIICDSGDVAYYPELVGYLKGGTKVREFRPETAQDIADKVAEWYYVMLPESTPITAEYLAEHGYPPETTYIFEE